MPETSTPIICIYCKKPYLAYKKGRTHCRKPTCREKEINKQLEDLGYFVELFCKNRIEATIELRFPGNDKLSRDAKIASKSFLNGGLKEKVSDIPAGISLRELMDYFMPVLWKGVKGNFIIKTLRDKTATKTKSISTCFNAISFLF